MVLWLVHHQLPLDATLSRDLHLSPGRLSLPQNGPVYLRTMEIRAAILRYCCLWLSCLEWVSVFFFSDARTDSLPGKKPSAVKRAGTPPPARPTATAVHTSETRSSKERFSVFRLETPSFLLSRNQWFDCQHCPQSSHLLNRAICE
jgi:hypothetical protein